MKPESAQPEKVREVSEKEKDYVVFSSRNEDADDLFEASNTIQISNLSMSVDTSLLFHPDEKLLKSMSRT